jgi:hypothetical protein
MYVSPYSVAASSHQQRGPTTLSLVDKSRYALKYEEMKQKYGVSLAKVWWW